MIHLHCIGEERDLGVLQNSNFSFECNCSLTPFFGVVLLFFNLEERLFRGFEYYNYEAREHYISILHASARDSTEKGTNSKHLLHINIKI